MAILPGPLPPHPFPTTHHKIQTREEAAGMGRKSLSPIGWPVPWKGNVGRSRLEQEEPQTTMQVSTNPTSHSDPTGQRWQGPRNPTLVTHWPGAAQEERGLSSKDLADSEGAAAGGCQLPALPSARRQTPSWRERSGGPLLHGSIRGCILLRGAFY